jgi:hypothetical protein
MKNYIVYLKNNEELVKKRCERSLKYIFQAQYKIEKLVFYFFMLFNFNIKFSFLTPFS